MLALPLEIIHQIAYYVGLDNPQEILNLMRTSRYLHAALVDSREHYSGLSTHLFPLQNPHLEGRPDHLSAAKLRVETAIRKSRAFRQTMDVPTPTKTLSEHVDIVQHHDQYLPLDTNIKQLFKDSDADPLNRWASEGLRLRWCKTVGVGERQTHVVFSLNLITGGVHVENTIPANTLLRLPHVLQKTEYFHMNPDRDFLASSRQAPVLVFDIADQRLSYQLTGRDGTPLALRRVGRGKITDLKLPRCLTDIDNLRVAQLCDRFSLVRVWRFKLEMLLLCDYEQMTCRIIKGGPTGHVTCVAVVKGLLWLTVTEEDDMSENTSIQEWYLDTKNASAMYIRNVCGDGPQKDLFSHATSDIMTGRYIKTRNRFLDTETLSVMSVKPISVFGVIAGQVHCWSFSKAWLDHQEMRIDNMINSGWSAMTDTGLGAIGATDMSVIMGPPRPREEIAAS
ncbi:YALIA101S10e04544g1_1 [Yarrowia lipolytica]|nr:YALIA101S10e04544g1_1 [Yarrowia lipolytica]